MLFYNFLYTFFFGKVRMGEENNRRNRDQSHWVWELSFSFIYTFGIFISKKKTRTEVEVVGRHTKIYKNEKHPTIQKSNKKREEKRKIDGEGTWKHKAFFTIFCCCCMWLSLLFFSWWDFAIFIVHFFFSPLSNCWEVNEKKGSTKKQYIKREKLNDIQSNSYLFSQSW